MNASWITGGAHPFYARKSFELTAQVQKATLAICGLGQFTAYINGRKVGDHELDPAWTDYRKYIQYVTFDVTELLNPGTNVLGAEVGNGWFLKQDEGYTFAFPPFMPPNPNPYQPFHTSLILSAELIVTLADGSVQVIKTDRSWKTCGHRVVMSNVYGSETLDNRREPSGWNTPEFDDSDWFAAQTAEAPKAELIPQYQPAVKVIHTYPAQFLYEKNGRRIYDLGQNISGILELTARGTDGAEVTVYPAEKLGPEGDVDQVAKNWCDLNVKIRMILSGDPEGDHFRMHFTYFAGRYLAVKSSDPEVEIRSLSADAISSAWKTDGRFWCDDERLNRIYTMIERTVEANLLGVHTDCPTIERFAWQEPNHLMAGSIFFMKDGSLLWDKFLRDMRAAQHTKEDSFRDFAGAPFYPGDGLMPSQAPCYIPNVLPVPGMGSFYDIIPWGSTCILGTWWHYEFYGDRKILKDNFEAGYRYYRYLRTKINEDGFINHGLGDWGNPKGELARENIETAFLYADAVTLAKMARLLGKTERAQQLQKEAEVIRDHYNEKLLVMHPDEGFLCYRCYDHPEEILLTQAAQALPLFWGMVPEEAQDDVERALRYTLERDDALIAGEIGLPYIIQSAAAHGMNDLICHHILKEEHPSYYAFILAGETTLGEYWEENPRSHCHDMMGHIIEWYYNSLAGIKRKTPGFAEVRICPWLPESIHELKASYESVYGRILVEVRETEDEICLTAAADPRIRMTVDTTGLEEKHKPVRVIQKLC